MSNGKEFHAATGNKRCATVDRTWSSCVRRWSESATTRSATRTRMSYTFYLCAFWLSDSQISQKAERLPPKVHHRFGT